jgi:hypothetical protein
MGKVCQTKFVWRSLTVDRVFFVFSLSFIAFMLPWSDPSVDSRRGLKYFYRIAKHRDVRND